MFPLKLTACSSSPLAGSAGVDRAWIMPLIDEYADRHFCPSSLYHPMKKGQAVMGFV